MYIHVICKYTHSVKKKKQAGAYFVFRLALASSQGFSVSQ